MMFRRKNQQGFTLIEMMIVVLMTSLIAAAMVYNFRAGEKQRRLILSRDNLVSALRTAQNYALSGKQIPPPSQAPHVRGSARCASDNSAVSYWIEMTAANNNIDVMAEDRCGAVMRVQRTQLISQTRYPTTNSFTLNIASVNTNSTTVAVRFTPPFGVMTATSTANPLPANFGTFTTATLNVEFQDSSRATNVTADGISGRIE